MEDLGQNNLVWQDSWNKLSINSEIQMWDYFGGRPWILKYVPRFGKTLEAGCGLGRYNFYLHNLGIDILGLDFSKDTIGHLESWSKKHSYIINFIEGNVTSLPFDENSLSCYISLGVIEHFIEGPSLPLNEAFRVLRPGGIAIITTPNHTWSKRFKRSLVNAKILIKRLLGYSTTKRGFFQYEYSPKQLKKHVAKAGFEVVEACGSDFLYTFTEVGLIRKTTTNKQPWFYRMSRLIDRSALKKFGAQSIVISVKKAEIMHCFFCGQLNSSANSLANYTVPVCSSCEKQDVAKHYKRGQKTYFHQEYSINPPFEKTHEEICEYCHKAYSTDPIFEGFGFNKRVCKTCLGKPEINLILANNNVKPIWRARVSQNGAKENN